MSTENLNPNSNGTAETEGDGSGKALESLFADGETSEDFVKRVNEKAGTQFTDLDSIAVSIQEGSKLAAELGRLKKEKGEGDGAGDGAATTTVTPAAKATDDVVELFFDGNADANRVRADLERVAKSEGRSVIAVWKDTENSGWLHEKSSSLRKTSEARDRVSDPSGQTHGKSTSEEAAIAKRLSGNLPPTFSAEKPKL